MRLGERVGANRAVLALSVARLGDAIGNSILFIVLPVYVAVLPSPIVRLSDPERVGILISLYGIANAAAQPFTGSLVDRTGRPKLLVQAGLFVIGAATIGFAFVGNFTVLLILRLLQGLGVGVTLPASMVILRSGTAQQTRGGSMGIYTSMRMLGLAIGPLIGGALLRFLGFDAAFYGGAAFIAVGFGLVQAWVRELPPRPRPRPPRHRVQPPAAFSAGLLGVGTATFAMAAAFTMLAVLEVQFNARLHSTALEFGIAFAAVAASRLLLQVPFGVLSDRIGRKLLIVAGLLLLGPSTALIGYATSIWELTGWRVLQGIAGAAIAAPSFALAADLSRAGRAGRQLSVVTMGFALGIGVGPLIAGFLARLSLALPFLVGAALALATAGLVAAVVPETVHRRPLRPPPAEPE
jgi:MFS family permease